MENAKGRVGVTDSRYIVVNRFLFSKEAKTVATTLSTLDSVTSTARFLCVDALIKKPREEVGRFPNWIKFNGQEAKKDTNVKI